MTDRTARRTAILVAEDDPDDRLMIRESFVEVGFSYPLHFVEDGEELIEYLRCQDRYRGLNTSVLPAIILLDLNMPRMDGFEALRIIKADYKLKDIPVIAFTTSKSEEDIFKASSLGVSAFLTKPETFEGLKTTLKKIIEYWLGVVELSG